jgi:hypothetical protein
MVFLLPDTAISRLWYIDSNSSRVVGIGLAYKSVDETHATPVTASIARCRQEQRKTEPTAGDQSASNGSAFERLVIIVIVICHNGGGS